MKQQRTRQILSLWDRFRTSALALWYSLRSRQFAFLTRRPHRSFRYTPKRDYHRSLALPGYWSFTAGVMRILWQRRTTYGLLILTYAVLTGVFVGLASQDSYTILSESLQETGSEVVSGNIGQVGQAGLLLLAGITGSLTGSATEAQQLYGLLFGLMVWLASVWLLRAQLAGKSPRLRDALYSSGAPIISTLLVLLVFIVQLIPIAVTAIAFSAATESQLLNQGVVAMLFSVIGVLLVTLSLYWITSTAIALVVVTLPGVYPMRAIKTAGDLVTSRRLRILYRWMWMVFILVLTWCIVVLPVIIVESMLRSVLPLLAAIPIVPVVLLLVGSFSIVFSSAYVYMLYRKVVDDDAQPA